MPASHVIRISRRVCASLCLADGPATPLDMALWLAVVGDMAAIVDEPDEDGITMLDGWAVSDAAAVWCHRDTLLAATGQPRLSDLARPFDRLGRTEFTLGLTNPRRFRLWRGWEFDAPSRLEPTAVGIVSGMVMTQTMIHGDPFPVAVDALGMARFRSRWSPLVYMRCLAWLAGAGTAKSWQRSRPGDTVVVTIPVDALHRGLGSGTLTWPGDWNARAFGRGGRGGPVHEDLESVGIRLKTEWVQGRVGLYMQTTGLRMTVSRLKVARDQHKATLNAMAAQGGSARPRKGGVAQAPIGF
ncbi:hypothetical protein [Methylobacterium sp. WL6]|uniref:hypothetical protein n=1 Tax=Methylobacterium sp. WL6 TaxID=2603901 RepID=UPI0011CB50C5|nr:hypothetical protein [Methylobacterium sp. WL6]TXN71906.1 hypothetical protein FV230_06915 [Methylobacterium sp. WL6]